MEDVTKQPQQSVPNTPAPSTELFAVRRQRIQQYIAEGLQKTDTGEALIQAFNGDLMSFATTISEGMQSLVPEGPVSLENLEPLLPAGAAFTRTTRQIANYTNVLLRLEDRRTNRQAGK